MQIYVQAKPRAREEKVEKIDETHFQVSVKEPPVQGKANAAILRALGDYFHVPTYQIRILSGQTSRSKIIEVHP